jgi:uncharacterized protein (TIGR03086 family)
MIGQCLRFEQTATLMDELLSLHRRGAESCAQVVNRVRPDQLGMITPCAGWTVRDLLAHTIGHNIGFAAAALGSSDAGAFTDVRVASDPAAQYAASTRAVIDAFTGPDLDHDELYLAVVRGGTRWPARTAIGFHLVDCVVHGWDVAVAIGASVSFDADVEQAAWTVAQNVPDDESRNRPGSSFRPSVSTSSTGLLDRILAALGRDPAWTQRA